MCSYSCIYVSCLAFFFSFFFFSSRRRHTRCLSDWSSDVCSSDLPSALRRAGGPRPDRPRAPADPDRLSLAAAALAGAAGRGLLRRTLRLRRSLRSEEHTSELQSLRHLVCSLLLEKKKKQTTVSSH